MTAFRPSRFIAQSRGSVDRVTSSTEEGATSTNAPAVASNAEPSVTRDRRDESYATRVVPELLHSAVMFVILLLGGCSHGGPDSKGADSSGPKRREATRVRTAPIEQREMVKTLTTTTVIESEHEIKLFPRTSGVVMEVKAEEGDRVSAGAVLAVLDRRQTRAMIEDARVAVREAEDNVRKLDMMKTETESRIESAQLKYDQTVRDYDRNAKADLISAQALDNLRVLRDTGKIELGSAKLIAQRADVEAKAMTTSLEKAKLALQRQELEDSYMEITAPFDGVIASRSMQAGDSVGPAAPVFVITDTKNLRAVFYRPQRELGLFIAAAKQHAEDGESHSASTLEIRALPEALPGVVFRAELQIVSPSIDPQSGSFRITVLMREPIEGPKDAKLLPGMLVRLEVVTERHPEALVVPKRALRREGEQNLVFVVDAGHARKVEVDELFSDDKYVEIHARTSGALAVGNHVIVVGNREIEDGAEVQEENTPDAADAPADAKPAEANTQQTDSAPKKG